MRRPLPTPIGEVKAVSGPSVLAVIDPPLASGYVMLEGRGYRVGQVGSFVRIPIGFRDLFGVVTRVGSDVARPRDEPVAGPFTEKDDAVREGNLWLEIQLIGEGERKGEFTRGITMSPIVGDKVHMLVEDDLARIYRRPESAQFTSVGTIAGSESIEALLDINLLVTHHAAIVGSTGSGKSTTVASLLAAVADAERYPSARVLVLDIHGEYGKALADAATVYRVQPSETAGEKQLFVPYWALSFDELIQVSFGGLDDTERTLLADEVHGRKLAAMEERPYPGVTPDTLTVDSPVPFSIRQMWYDLHLEVCSTHSVPDRYEQCHATMAFARNAEGGNLEGDAANVVRPTFRGHRNVKGDADKVYLSQSPLNIRRQLDALEGRLRDRRLDFLFKPGPWDPVVGAVPGKDIDALFQDWLGAEKPVVVLDLSGVPSSVLMILCGALLRLVFDFLFWARNLSEGGRERPLWIVLEEAHAYLADKESSAAKSVMRIVKEGRKYGVGALIVSQRPTEIETTILSQCGTIVALRLSNAQDRGHVAGAIPDNLGDLVANLPSLRTGEAVIVGEAVHLPMRAFVRLPREGRRPDSSDPKIATADDEPGGWTSPRAPADYPDAVRSWREQSPRSAKIAEVNDE
jgi:hypothetical protein